MPMNERLFCTLAFLLLGSVAEASEADLRHHNLGKGNLAASGYDVVSYFSETGPRLGKEAISFEREGVVYRFSSEANREAFAASPESYAPAFGGWCAWAMLEGGKTKINPKSYKIYEGRLFLFYDGLWGDTLKMWNEKAASEAEDQMALAAAAMWDKLLDG